MKELVTAVALIGAVAAAILAAAVFKTWNVEHMTMLTRSISIACLVIPALGVVVATVIVVQRVVDHHYDEREAAAAAKRAEAERRDMERLIVAARAAQGVQRLDYGQAQTEAKQLQAARLYGLLQAPPAQIEAPANPWIADNDDWDVDDHAPISL